MLSPENQFPATLIADAIAKRETDLHFGKSELYDQCCSAMHQAMYRFVREEFRKPGAWERNDAQGR